MKKSIDENGIKAGVKYSGRRDFLTKSILMGAGLTMAPFALANSSLEELYFHAGLTTAAVCKLQQPRLLHR